MKKILFILALLLCPLSAPGQQGALQGTSTLGGISATTQGAQSSNKLQGVIPAAKISIYLTNTTTLATLTTDGTHSLSNPFYSNASNAVNPGGFVAFAATNVGYDIVASSGQGVPNCTTGPLCYTLPVTLCKDCYPTQSFTPVVGAFQTNGVNNSNQALLNHVDTATVKFTNPSGGVESATVPNATNSSLGAAQCDGITIKCASGVLSTIPGSGLDMFVNAPTTGTWLPIYPTGYTITGQQSYSTATASNTAGQIVDAGCNGVGTCVQPLLTKVTWTFALPSYINPANVTSVYASGLASTSNFGTGGGYSPSAYLYCYQSTIHVHPRHRHQRKLSTAAIQRGCDDRNRLEHLYHHMRHARERYRPGAGIDHGERPGDPVASRGLGGHAANVNQRECADASLLQPINADSRHRSSGPVSRFERC